MRGGTVWSRADCSKSCIICWTRAEPRPPELAEKFEVSVRTIYRDLDAISAAGIPIYTVQGKGGGIFILPEFVLEKSLLTPQERLISVRLKFSQTAAFRVYDEFTDTVEKDAQGSLYVTVDMPERTLYSYILSYGDAVEILEPDELRRSMKEKLTRMAEKYKT